MPVAFLNILLLTFSTVTFLSHLSYGFTFITALMFSSVLAVVDYIGDLNYSKRLDGLQKGEILLGCAFNILMYTIFKVYIYI